MTVKTPAELKTLYESISFDLQTTYTGPLGQEYAVSGTHLRLWAPTAQRVEVSLYRKGSGGEPIGTLPLERGPQGVWSIYLPGDQHGRYYTYTVTVDGISRQTGDPLSLIHISEPTRRTPISYAVFCLKKKKNKQRTPTEV